ncbi:MAG: hypothetical protein IT315_11405 [Anaerolineales bacterium]|nr:hypothetical protein [Anaerolineales bacterium]
MKPGDYVGLYIDDKLIYTGVLKDIGKMESGRTIYQVLLVKNIFQRNYPEVHFSDQADVRSVTLESLREEVKRLKINLQKNIEKMEPEHVSELVGLKEWDSIVG